MNVLIQLYDVCTDFYRMKNRRLRHGFAVGGSDTAPDLIVSVVYEWATATLENVRNDRKNAVIDMMHSDYLREDFAFFEVKFYLLAYLSC